MTMPSHPLVFSLQGDLQIPRRDGPAFVANSMNGHNPPKGNARESDAGPSSLLARGEEPHRKALDRSVVPAVRRRPDACSTVRLRSARAKKGGASRLPIDRFLNQGNG